MKTKRLFFLNDEWIYAKLYCSSHIQQQLLKYEISNFVEKLYKKKAIKKFFFVNYADSKGPHLRLRFLPTDNTYKEFIIKNISNLTKIYVDHYHVVEPSFHVYERELERYGKKNIEHFETISSINSWFTLCFLKKEPIFDEVKWLQGCMIIERQLSFIGFTLNDKILYCRYVLHFLHKKTTQPLRQKNNYRQFIKAILLKKNACFVILKKVTTIKTTMLWKSL